MLGLARLRGSITPLRSPAILPNAAYSIGGALASPGTPSAPLNPMEVLVYNVSHADLILSVAETPKTEGQREEAFKVRPRFSFFERISETMCKALEQLQQIEAKTKTNAVTPALAGEKPVGFLFDEVAAGKLQSDLRWKEFSFPKGRDASAELASAGHREFQDPAHPRAVYFPLMAAVIPKWLSVLDKRVHTKAEKYLYLVSGGGVDDTTEHTSLLIGSFVRAFYPEVNVVHVNSGTDIFRYDTNVDFVNGHLKPHIMRLRSRAAAQFGEHWPSMFNVTLCLTEGAQARVSAIIASMREFRPSTIHILRMRTFFEQNRIAEEEVEYHTFDTTDATPTYPRATLTGDLAKLVAKMVDHSREYQRVLSSGHHEISDFWLRKTLKPVCSVLMVKKENQAEPTFYCSTNLEVSMPTGSLCAERNAIGNALASDLTLTRHEIRAVAVLSLPTLKKPTAPPPGTPETPVLVSDGLFPGTPTAGGTVAGSQPWVGMNPLSPCGACTEWLRKIREVNPDFKILTFLDSSCERVCIRTVE